MPYDKRAIMKEAHKRYKADRERFPNAPLKFSEYLEITWFECKYDEWFYQNYIESAGE